MTVSQYCPLLDSFYISESRLDDGPVISCYTITTKNHRTHVMDIMYSTLDQHQRRQVGVVPTPKNWICGR